MLPKQQLQSLSAAGLDDLEFINRPAEDEIRAEMDREAVIAKARMKLAEAKGNQQLLSSF